ncbi:MAG: hypothetical protein AAFX50_01415, partial [Acidobacteriota bacterium]
MTPATFDIEDFHAAARPSSAARALRLALVSLLAGLFGAAAAAGQPTAATAVDLDAERLIGEAFGFDVTFDNAGDAVGFGPFVDLVFPTDGADGGGGLDTQDGLTFLGATYLGRPVASIEIPFPDDGDGTGCVAHGVLAEPTGEPAEVCGDAGDVLVTLSLPFGSFVPDQPSITLRVNARLHAFADLGAPLTVRRRGGYRFGADPLDNPGDDPPIAEGGEASALWPGASTRPQVATLRQVYVGPEDETATGPNYPRRYRVLLDVAAGQALSNVRLTEDLAEPLAFLELVSAAPAFTVAHAPPVGVAAAAPSNRVEVDFPAVLGGAGDNDAEALIAFFAPRLDAAGEPVLDPATGAPRTVDSAPRAVGTWRPLDPRDPATPDNVVITGVDAVHSLTLRSVAIQKSHADLDGEPLAAGDTLRYALDIQVSDYFALDALDLVDVFSDGQRFTADSMALDFTRQGDAAAGAVSPSRYDVHVATAPAPAPHAGSTTVTLDLTAALADLGLAGPAVGGCVTPAAPATADCSASNLGATRGVLSFDAAVQQEYSDAYPSGDPSVDEGDRIHNDVDIDADVLALADFAATGHRPADDSRGEDRLPFGVITTSIYAVNGQVVTGGVDEIFPGDAVTYRLRHTLPTANVEAFRITSFLPLPVFDVAELTAFDDVESAAAPGAGAAAGAPAAAPPPSGPPPRPSRRWGVGAGARPWGCPGGPRPACPLRGEDGGEGGGGQNEALARDVASRRRARAP